MALPIMKFELLVAIRYLKAKRKQAVISLITVIAILGVGAGVAALVVALAINAGQRRTFKNGCSARRPISTIYRRDRRHRRLH